MAVPQIKCCLCGDGDFKVIEKDESPFLVLKCNQCSLVFVHPNPDAAELQNHYGENYYFEWIKQQEGRRIRMWQHRLDKIQRLSLKGKLLDVGCGEGLFLELAEKAGWQIHGTEISRFASGFAARRLGKYIFCGEVWEAAFDSNSFDVVTMWHVLEHMRDPSKVLHEIHRIIRPDGYLIIAVPNVNDIVMQIVYLLLKGRKLKLFSIDSKEIHLFHFSADTIQAFLERSGFKAHRIGPDFGIIEVPKRLINYLATAAYYMTGVHVYNAIEVISRPLK